MSEKKVEEVTEVRNARRDFLKLGLAAATGAAAAGVVAAPPAEAANGQSLVIGTENQGSSTTVLKGSSFQVIDGNLPASIYGVASADGKAGIIGSHSGYQVVQTGMSSTSMLSTVITTGIGLHGVGNGPNSVGVRAAAGEGAALQLDPVGVAVPPTQGSWVAGQFVVKNGQLWYCIAGGDGSSSKWVRLSSVYVPLPEAVPAYSAGTALNTGQKRKVNLGSVVPANATSAVLTFSLASPSGQGTLAVGSFARTTAKGTVLRWWDNGQQFVNTTVSGVSESAVWVAAKGKSGAGKTKFKIEVVGYYL